MSKLLAEIIKQQLRTFTQHSQRRIISHCCSRLLSVDTHRYNRIVHIFRSIAEHEFMPYKVRHGIVHFTSALQFLQLNTLYSLSVQDFYPLFLKKEIFRLPETFTLRTEYE